MSASVYPVNDPMVGCLWLMVTESVYPVNGPALIQGRRRSPPSSVNGFGHRGDKYGRWANRLGHTAREGDEGRPRSRGFLRESVVDVLLQQGAETGSQSNNCVPVVMVDQAHASVRSDPDRIPRSVVGEHHPVDEGTVCVTRPNGQLDARLTTDKFGVVPCVH